MPRSTLTSKGQITIPKKLRDRLGLEAGDVLEWTEDDQGRILVRPRKQPDGCLGSLRHRAPRRPVTIEEMRRAVRRKAAEKARSGR